MVSPPQNLPVPETRPDPVIFKASPLSCSDSERANVLPELGKSRDEELDEETSCISTTDTQATDIATTSNESLLGQSIPREVESNAPVSEQKTAVKAKQILQENQICDNAAVPPVDTQHEHCTSPAEISNHDEPLGATEPQYSHSVSPSKSDMLGESEPPKPATALPELIASSLDILPKQCSAEHTTNRAVPLSSASEQTPAVLESKGTAESVRPSPDPNASMNPISAVMGSLKPKEPLNNRDLARIALLCAKGTRLTALQVIDWLASRFPYLQKGQGAWERNIKSVLSHLSEIDGVKAPYQQITYSFASAALRAENEKRYQSYLTPSLVPGPEGGVQKARESVQQQLGANVDDQHEHFQSEPPTQVKKSVTRAIKSAPSRPSVPIHGSFPLPNTARVTSEDNAMFHPFERATAPRPKIALADVETKRETSFRSVYPRTTTPSIETMTSEQKATKIAEIKTRPKRKQFFGPAHRLAHVRRYGRQDIHDESDGTWKSDSTGERPMPEHDSAINDCDENQSLLEILNLPKNAIPMNDGKELAFRDGTLVGDPIPDSHKTT
jgi:hypothetical protein